MRRQRRWFRWLLAVSGAVVLALAGTWWWSMPSAGDPFYTPPAQLPPAAGTLLRSEPYTHDIPSGARAWRILYTTRDAHGAPALASALVVAPTVGQAPYPVVAWTHGTTGAVPGCGPLPLGLPFANVPAFPQAIQAGWAFVATDYAGMAAPGVAPYLVGLGEARSTLDALRAARQVRGLALADATVVWGHSQGGHAALWTGVEWPRHAPELRLLGIAAAAPATDLPVLLSRIADEPVGRIMGAFVLRAYADTYHDVDFGAETHAASRWLARDMSARCLAGKQALVSVGEAMLAGGSIFAGAPADGAFGARLRENIPPPLTDLPAWIAQGDRDTLVLPDVQRGYVQRACAAGATLEYREYPGEDHLSLVKADGAYARDLLAWTQARFAGAPARGCR